MKFIAAVILAVICGAVYAQSAPPPIIDMHLHAIPLAYFEEARLAQPRFLTASP